MTGSDNYVLSGFHHPLQGFSFRHHGAAIQDRIGQDALNGAMTETC